MENRKVIVFTGNRAEFSMLTPIIKGISDHPNLTCHLVVSGAHLEEKRGSSINEIESEGIEIGSKIYLDHTTDKGDVEMTTKIIGEVILKFTDTLLKEKPDLVLIASDRFESFGACIAATQLNLPVAHFEGGDITQGGALDDSLRHAMTKLAHIHFTTNEEASTRVKRLGEEPWRVHTVGFPGIDVLRTGDFMSTEEVISSLNLRPGKPLIVFTQHSVTIEPEKAADQVKPSLKALNRLAADKDANVIITYPNNDAGGMEIIKEIDAFKAEAHENIVILPHLGRSRYYGVLNICGKVGTGVCIGNSSSGIKETPIFHCPSIIIGTRQDGRLRAGNVEEVDYDEEAIYKAAEKAMENEAYRKMCAEVVNPYGEGRTGETIANILSTVPVDKTLINKQITY